LIGKEKTFDGFYQNTRQEFKDSFLGNYHVGDLVTYDNLSLIEAKTQPKSRYTSGSIIKEMEDKGIGRPSTYSTTIENLTKNGYIALTNGSIHPTSLGKFANLYLSQNFKRIISSDYTKEMERCLDLISGDDIEGITIPIHESFQNRLSVLNEFYTNLKYDLKHAEPPKCRKCQGELTITKHGRIVEKIECHKCNHTFEFVKPITDLCPLCDSLLVRRSGKNGQFVGCSRYPKCNYTVSTVKKKTFKRTSKKAALN
jgi:DNA topoisomerase-1